MKNIKPFGPTIGKTKISKKFLDIIKLIELPETTIILHTRAITGNIV